MQRIAPNPESGKPAELISKNIEGSSRSTPCGTTNHKSLWKGHLSKCTHPACVAFKTQLNQASTEQ